MPRSPNMLHFLVNCHQNCFLLGQEEAFHGNTENLHYVFLGSAKLTPKTLVKGVQLHMFQDKMKRAWGVYLHGLIPESQGKELFMLTIQK